MEQQAPPVLEVLLSLGEIDALLDLPADRYSGASDELASARAKLKKAAEILSVLSRPQHFPPDQSNSDRP